METNNNYQPKRFLIVYHREDNDGIFSMALLYQHLVHALKVCQSDISIFGADYDEMNKADIDNWLKSYDTIMMTDISLPVDKMKKLFDTLGSEFIWCDHHAPIIQECNENGMSTIPGSRLTDRSAIWNVYDYLYNPFHLNFDNPENSARRPELLLCLSAFDSFTFEMWGYDKQYVLDIMEGCNIEFNLDPQKIISYIDLYINGFESDEQFTKFNEMEIERFRKSGSTYNKIVENNTARMLQEYGAEFTVGGKRKAMGLVSIGFKGSDVFKSVKDEYESGVIFKRLKNGKWVICLYNTDYNDTSFHCGEYLKKKYKGGGHLGAAGCQVDEETFFKILKSKKL